MGSCVVVQDNRAPNGVLRYLIAQWVELRVVAFYAECGFNAYLQHDGGA